MSSEKMHAKIMLDWAEQNFFETHMNSATRKGNILDLVFSNSNSLINGYTTIVNTSFSDHNILRINLNYKYKNEEEKKKKKTLP